MKPKAYLISTTALALGCLSLFASATGAQQAWPQSDRLILLPGKSLHETLQAREKAQAPERRARWLSHHQPAPGANAPPKISFGKIYTPSIDVAAAPAAPGIQVKFTTNPSGLAQIYATFTSSDGTESIYTYDDTQIGDPPLTQGTRVIQRRGGFPDGTFSRYSKPGAWTLSFIDICDNLGNCTSYDGHHQLDKRFPGGRTIQVVNNGKVDAAAPMIAGGEIMTDVVHLSDPFPNFAAKLNLSDDMSGVNYYWIEVVSPSGNYYEGFEDASAPIMNRTAAAYVDLAGSGETGRWTISAAGACDWVYQCTYVEDPAEIKALFGKKGFRVEN